MVCLCVPYKYGVSKPLVKASTSKLEIRRVVKSNELSRECPASLLVFQRLAIYDVTPIF